VKRAPDRYEQLKGKTLMIYTFLLRQSRPLSAREIQRRTGISSPSLALYHLSKLMQVGLVEQDIEEGFLVTKVVKTGMLTFFVVMGRHLVPRFLFYAIFVTCFLMMSLLLFDWVLTPLFLLLIAVLAFSMCVFWFETVNLWRYQSGSSLE